MKTRFESDGAKTLTCNCGCGLLVLLVNIALGIWSVNYLLLVFFEKTMPIFWAFVVGLFLGEFTVPAAVMTLILKNFGIL